MKFRILISLFCIAAFGFLGRAQTATFENGETVGNVQTATLGFEQDEASGNVQTATLERAQDADNVRTPHSVGVSWSYFGFNSTHSKNSDKKTFGTVGINYEYRFNRWISASGNLGLSHCWLGGDAEPAYAYPKKDNAVLILAGCNVTWLHRGLLEMYSGFAGGLDIRVQKNDRGAYTTLGLAGQFDAVGLRLNWSHAYLDMAAGWGSTGCIRLGAGFRF